MWVVFIIAYLFTGFVIGSAMCKNAGDDPNDNDSFLTILAIGFVWPVIILIVSFRVLVTAATFIVELCTQFFTDNTQNEEESNE